MKSWYLTRDGITGSQHRGIELLPNKYVKLTEQQAQIHNKNKKEPSVIKADSLPINPGDCQFSDEFEFVEPTPKAKKKGNVERES